MGHTIVKDQNGQWVCEVPYSDYILLANPLLNKGMAFTSEERKMFHLQGLLPPQIATLEEQQARSYEALHRKTNELEKYIYLRDLQDSNETLFYSLLLKHIEELMPLVYTPTVGAGCQLFSHIYRRPRGIFISYPDRDAIEEILSNPRFDQAEVIVVSDGERILGLGDQGAGGMGIPIGKLVLYTACAGIHPSSTLPILLDVGTNNAELIKDPLYIGWRHERIRGQEYEEFIEVFIKAVKKRFPHILLQWEDFAQQNALPLLERYRDQLCTFNDDIQGTAAVTVGAVLSAVRMAGSNLKDQKIVIVGAGSAGCGISHLMLQAMQEKGLSEKEARSRFFLIDREGLLVEGMSGLLPFQKPFAQPKSFIEKWKRGGADEVTFKETIFNVHPTLLIGVSGRPGIFTEEIIREMAAHVSRPIIFPLSNPTSRSEAIPADLIRWTEGKAIIGTGSPFAPVIYKEKTFRIDQTNNSYIFPGVGLGLVVSRAKRVTDRIFLAAAKALAKCSENSPSNLLPFFKDIREVSAKIALAVAEEAVRSGLAESCPSKILAERIQNKMWVPRYLPYRYRKNDI